MEGWGRRLTYSLPLASPPPPFQAIAAAIKDVVLTAYPLIRKIRVDRVRRPSIVLTGEDGGTGGGTLPEDEAHDGPRIDAGSVIVVDFFIVVGLGPPPHSLVPGPIAGLPLTRDGRSSVAIVRDEAPPSSLRLTSSIPPPGQRAVQSHGLQRGNADANVPAATEDPEGAYIEVRRHRE